MRQNNSFIFLFRFSLIFRDSKSKNKSRRKR